LKHLPILQFMKSNGLSRIRFTDTIQFLKTILTTSKTIVKHLK